MLQLAVRIGFGMDVRYLFELERPFQRQRKVGVSADVQEILVAVISLSKLLDLLIECQRFLQGVNKFCTLGELLSCQCKSQLVESNKLCGKCFCGCDADFRAGSGIEHVSNFTCNGAIYDINDAQCPR